MSLISRHAWLHRLTIRAVQRTGCLHVVHKRKPSSNPPLDGPYLSLLIMASWKAAIHVPPPQIARQGCFLEPFLLPLSRRVGNRLVYMGHDHDGNDFSRSTLRETDRPPAYLFVLSRSYPDLPGHPLVKALG